MSEVYELLKQKELELQKISQEVEALRITIRLLEQAHQGLRENARTNPAPYIPGMATAISQDALSRSAPGPNPVKSFENGSAAKVIKQFP